MSGFFNSIFLPLQVHGLNLNVNTRHLLIFFFEQQKNPQFLSESGCVLSCRIQNTAEQRLLVIYFLHEK